MLILLEERDSEPLYVQIYRQIKEMIAAGQLRPGERLPSTRALAATPVSYTHLNGAGG